MADTATRFAARAQAGHRADAGFTLAEMLVVAALIAIGSAVAIPVTMQMVIRARHDSSVVVAQTFIDGARDRAVAERRNIELEFQMPNRMRMYRIEVPSGARTLVGDMQLEGAQEFVKISGVSADTPDLFATGCCGAVTFTGTQPVMFTSDGSLIDANGDVVNGTVFFGEPNKAETARAVAVFGMTGMLRIWKWRGAQWFQ